MAEDFTLCLGEISGLGGFGHASGLGYHHKGVVHLSQQIFFEGSPCAKYSSRYSK